MRLDFTITMIPKAQKRARNRGFIIKGGGKNGQDIARSQTYKDDTQDLEEQKFISLLYEHRPPAPLQGAILIGVRAYVSIPKKSKKWQAAALAGTIRPETKPDFDNLTKHFKDCCKGVFWPDDKHVVGWIDGFASGKYYGDVPRWEICIMTLDELQIQPPVPEAIAWKPKPQAEVRLL
jgi:Holliday junction resolvase RusA-like endonuclease